MNRTLLRQFTATCFLFLLGLYTGVAQEEKQEEKPIPEAQSFVTQHQIVNGGKSISFAAKAAEHYLKDEEGKPVASVWAVAYTKKWGY